MDKKEFETGPVKREGEMGALDQVTWQHVPRLLGTGPRREEVQLEQPQGDSPSGEQQNA